MYLVACGKRESHKIGRVQIGLAVVMLLAFRDFWKRWVVIARIAGFLVKLCEMVHLL